MVGFKIHSVVSSEVCGRFECHDMIKECGHVELSCPHHSVKHMHSLTLKGNNIFCLITMVTVSEAVVSIGHICVCLGGRDGNCNGDFQGYRAKVRLESAVISE